MSSASPSSSTTMEKRPSAGIVPGVPSDSIDVAGGQRCFSIIENDQRRDCFKRLQPALEQYLPNPSWASPFGTVVAMVAAVATAYFLCSLVEEPLRRMGRRPI